MAIAQSSHLQSHEYDPNSRTLTIQFQNGSVYQYSGVPLDVANGLAQNGGAGSYFWTKIRDRYPFTKIVSGPGSQK
jgi:hypothetical protein